MPVSAVTSYPTLYSAPGFNYNPRTVYNVSLLMEEDVNNLAIQTSQNLAGRTLTEFQLGSQRSQPRPHDSLYMIYADKNPDTERQLVKRVQEIARNTTPFKLEADAYLLGGDRMFEIKRQNTDDVRLLQKQVVETTQDLRADVTP